MLKDKTVGLEIRENKRPHPNVLAAAILGRGGVPKSRTVRRTTLWVGDDVPADLAGRKVLLKVVTLEQVWRPFAACEGTDLLAYWHRLEAGVYDGVANKGFGGFFAAGGRLGFGDKGDELAHFLVVYGLVDEDSAGKLGCEAGGKGVHE